MSVCAEPGCPVLANGRCPAHRRPDRSRNHHGVSPSRRGHGYAYTKRRAEILADNPLCHWGCGKPATTADYAIPWSRGGTLDDLVPSCANDNYARGARLLRVG